jgi:hypothetical protein
MQKPKCPECGANYTPGEPSCPECFCDLSPILVEESGNVTVQKQSVDNTPKYYCVPPDLSQLKSVDQSDGNLDEASSQSQDDFSTSALYSDGDSFQEATCPMLIVEGNQTVLYEGRAVSEFPFDVDEFSIGCRDTENGHYPDIDLLKYRLHDPYLSRKHATFFKEEDKYFIKVLSEADSTGFNNKSDIIEAGERREIKIGDRIFFSDSIVITLK